MPFVIGYIVWQVQTMHRLQTDMEKISEWKSGFVNYPKDASDLQVRIQGRIDGQLASLISQIASLNTEVGKLSVRLELGAVR